jgi:hypothetical protein
MKSRMLTWITAITLVAVPAIPVLLAAQDQQRNQHKFHPYQFIDIGTFGGPASYINNDPSGDGGAAGILSPRGVFPPLPSRSTIFSAISESHDLCRRN